QRVGPQKYGKFVEQDSFVRAMQDLCPHIRARRGFFWHGNEVFFQQILAIGNTLFYTTRLEDGHGGEYP
ncbi:MAG: hypothetical protein RL647_48, partial [Bacteroidota bacterium]